MLGRSNDLNGVGVYGTAPSGVAVHGESATGTAVGARSNTGAGVRAQSTSGTALTGISSTGLGVYCKGGPFGLVGEPQGGNGVALRGSTTTGFGVFGSAEANGSTGVYGESHTAGAYGVPAVSTQGVGLHASGGVRAAVFVGDVEVQSNLTVLGGFTKSAAIKHPDGTFRRFYSVEAPGRWHVHWCTRSIMERAVGD
ncbi:MAG: hypothetical protein IT305_19140 [Chloroflexi bacterium]|nr:hypothetical protein [Chloroflexota bacterium]